MKKISFLFIVGLMLVSGCKIDNKWNCFGASSPANLEIKNPTEKKVQIIFLVYSKENGYDKLGNLKLNPYETKIMCFENEGAIINGLYLYYNQQVSRIKLSNLALNKFDLDSHLHEIELTDDLLKAIK